MHLHHPPLISQSSLVLLLLASTGVSGFLVGNLTMWAARDRAARIQRILHEPSARRPARCAPRRKRPPPVPAVTLAPLPPPPAPTLPAVAPPPPPPTRVAVAPAEPGEARLLRLGPDHFEVSSSLLEALAADLPLAAAPTPGSRGLRVARLGDTSPASWLGLRRGDRLVAIDGLWLGSGDQFRLRRRLRQAFDVRLTVLREGRPFDLRLERASGVLRVSQTRYEVHRKLLDQLLDHPSQLGARVRLVPWRGARLAAGPAAGATGGGPSDTVVDPAPVQGIKLFGLRSDSILAALGLQNGDVLLRINGTDLARPDHALEAYARVRQTSLLVVEIRRKGQRIVFEYLIRS